ncbi:MAG TPA: hypothetical protein VL137_17140 [Polyangiaceae bacterium]|nr:hypothetical protein [Polyangiaceae bacterium]
MNLTLARTHSPATVRRALLVIALGGLLSYCAAPQQLGTVPVNNSGLRSRLLVASEITGGAKLHRADEQSGDSGSLSETVRPQVEATPASETARPPAEVTTESETVTAPPELIPERDQ